MQRHGRAHGAAIAVPGQGEDVGLRSGRLCPAQGVWRRERDRDSGGYARAAGAGTGSSGTANAEARHVRRLEAQHQLDYIPDLSRVANGLAVVVGQLDAINKHPAFRMAPEQHSHAIAKAANGLMREAAEARPGDPGHVARASAARQPDRQGTQAGRATQLRVLARSSYGFGIFSFGLPAV